ncbi:MAG: hypothetical protein AABZ30_00235 [Myxococcota bacterium]
MRAALLSIVVASAVASAQEAMPAQEQPYYPNDRYIAIGGGMSFFVRDGESAETGATFAPNDYSDLTIENGGRYWAGSIGLGFPDDGFILGFGFRIYYPIELKPRFFAEPQFSLAVNNGYFDDFGMLQVGIGPGLRLRYDLVDSFALYLQAFKLDFFPYTGVTPELGEADRVKGLVALSAGAGVEIRY